MNEETNQKHVNRARDMLGIFVFSAILNGLLSEFTTWTYTYVLLLSGCAYGLHKRHVLTSLISLPISIFYSMALLNAYNFGPFIVISCLVCLIYICLGVYSVCEKAKHLSKQ